MTGGDDLLAAIDELAESLEGLERDAAEGRVSYRRSGVEFAVAEAAAASFRLRPEIVAAALHTPDTSVAARGPDWVTLAPAELDEFALDRALAWFESAWKLAGEPPAAKRARVH